MYKIQLRARFAVVSRNRITTKARDGHNATDLGDKMISESRRKVEKARDSILDSKSLIEEILQDKTLDPIWDKDYSAYKTLLAVNARLQEAETHISKSVDQAWFREYR